MTKIKQAVAKIDSKGRLTLPKNIRKALGIDNGDVVFIKYIPTDNQVYLSPAINPFDVLTEKASEYKNGGTK
jgi:AbrB family looped-hinge helix DNA binding protein